LAFAPRERLLPEDLQEEIANTVFSEVRIGWINRDYPAVEQIYRNMLKSIQESEKKLRHPLHKGLPLYNLGMSLIAQNKMNDALLSILQAYVEDALSEEENNEDEIDRGAAANTLRDFFLIKLSILGQIKRKTVEIKAMRRLHDIYEPTEVLLEVAKNFGFDLDNVLSQCRKVPAVIPGKQPFGFPQDPDKRVFIGGNYRDHMPILRKIADYVARAGYVPIIADDAYIPEEKIHQYTLMLLHTCCYAIFDVTPPEAGQFMEIERSPDYSIRMLVVWSAKDPESAKNPPPWISTMIRSLRNEKEFDMKGYMDLDYELPKIIFGFLEKFRKV